MLRLKQKKEEKAAAAPAPEAAVAVADGAQSPAPASASADGAEGKQEIKLFNSIGGVALAKGNGAKSARQITPGELRIQRGMVLPSFLLSFLSSLFPSF
jgi:hypothetical protein